MNAPSIPVKCPACGYENPPDMRFCGMCGSLLQKRTPVAPKADQAEHPAPVFILRYGRRGELRQAAERCKGEYVIGRLAGCHIQLDDPLISRHHANLAVGQDAVWLMDLESTNGTRFNEGKLTPNQRYRLQPGDIFEIAAYVFELDIVPGSLPPTLPPATRKDVVPAFTVLDGLDEAEIRQNALPPTAPPKGVMPKPVQPFSEDVEEDTDEKDKEPAGDHDLLICPLCQGGNPHNTTFCIYCSAVVNPAGVDCPGCGFHNPAGNLFCERCGEKLSEK